jgi:hypothetical protein
MPETATAVARCVLPVPGPPMNTTFCAVSVKAIVASVLTKLFIHLLAAKSNRARSRWMGNRAALS